MVIRKKKTVSFKVDESFFDKLDRKRDITRRKLGLSRLTHPDFTRMLAKSDILDAPLLSKNEVRKNKRVRKKR